MRDEKVLAAIKGAVSLYDKIDNMISTQPEELQKVDFEISDWLHYIEGNDTTDRENVVIMKKLRELRLLRRSLHKEYEIEKTYKDNIMKMNNVDNRKLLLAEINKTIKRWENEYKNRILSDEDIKAFLAPKKGGRPKKVLEGGEKDGEKSSD